MVNKEFPESLCLDFSTPVRLGRSSVSPALYLWAERSPYTGRAMCCNRQHVYRGARVLWGLPRPYAFLQVSIASRVGRYVSQLFSRSYDHTARECRSRRKGRLSLDAARMFTFRHPKGVPSMDGFLGFTGGSAPADMGLMSVARHGISGPSSATGPDMNPRRIRTNQDFPNWYPRVAYHILRPSQTAASSVGIASMSDGKRKSRDNVHGLNGDTGIPDLK